MAQSLCSWLTICHLIWDKLKRGTWMWTRMMVLNLPLVVSFSWAAEAEHYILHFQEQF